MAALSLATAGNLEHSRLLYEIREAKFQGKKRDYKFPANTGFLHDTASTTAAVVCKIK
jgi:hypothetical protein